MLHLHHRLLSPKHFSDLAENDGDQSASVKWIGHRILEQDRRAETVPALAFLRLDEVVSHVREKVSDTSASTIEEARQVLTEIEKAVTSMNFVCSIPYYLVHSFTEGILPRSLDRQVVFAPENDLRRAHVLSNEDEKFSHVDCDIGSLLYLSIAEALKIPLCMVEVPQHNFVRWRLNKSQHLNWDTNFGFNKYSDSGYAARYGVNPKHIVNGTYLADLSVTEVSGYFNFVRGITFQRSESYKSAVDEYRKGIQDYSRSPSSRNNLAWLFVSVRSVQEIVSGDEALTLALKACDIDRSHNYLDTLACVYAEIGDFAEAIATETEAYNQNPLPSYMKMIQAFENGKTWLDINEG